MKMQKTIPALPVKDIKASCSYYTNKLGFTIRHQEEKFAIAVRDDIEILNATPTAGYFSYF